MRAAGAPLEIWGDESGNLDFDARTGTRFFFVSTMCVETDPSLTRDLLDLRRRLDRSGFELPDGFHATDDRQAVRDEVLELLQRREIRVDVTYYTKANVYDRIKTDPDYFYKWAWFYHLRYVLPRIVPVGSEPFIGIATLGTKKRRQLHADALRDVVRQSLRFPGFHCAHWASASHPCLQASDYYIWAVARWIEGGDDRSYAKVRHQIRTLYRFI